MPLDQQSEFDIATRLRESELSAIRVQVQNGLREIALKTLDERGGAQELVKQQYTGRYPFELLQNANDAARGSGSRGRAHFRVTDTALIVADNGTGFGEPQIKAICSLGRSSKAVGEAVGHKGLGFKSVGEITDSPQIVSTSTSFQFHNERLRKSVGEHLGNLPPDQRFPIYAFPFPIDGEDLGPDVDAIEELRSNGFSTIIRLPFRRGVDRQSVENDLLENLHARLLLFLPHIDHLELQGTSDDFSSEVARDNSDVVEHALLDTDGVAEDWLIYRGSVSPDSSTLEPLGEGWSEIDQARFAIAVPVDENARPIVDETFPLHVYFPTDERPGLHVAIHAEWVLSMDRRSIAKTPEAILFNRFLFDSVIGHLRTSVIQDLMQRTSSCAETVQALVPAMSPPVGESGIMFRELWSETLCNLEFLPCADALLRSPADIRLLPRSLRTPGSAHEVAELDPLQTLRPDVEQCSAVTTFLRGLSVVEEMSNSELISLLVIPARDTADRYYGFIIQWLQDAGMRLVNDLKKAPCVLVTSGQVLTPESDTIFFPRERGDAIIPEDLPVPFAVVPQVDGAQNFLRELGVRPFEWRDLIREFLVKILSDKDSDKDLRRRAMGGLWTYHQTRLKGSEDLEPVLARVLLPARSMDQSIQELRPAGEIYFNTSWLESNDLDVIYGPFGEAEFLDVAAPEDSEERQTELDFYRMLGVSDFPRLEEAKAADNSGYLISTGRHPHRGQFFNEWLATLEVSEAAKCPQGHPQTQQLKLSYRLDRHDDLISTGDPMRLIALWNQLARRWGAIYEVGMDAIFCCVNSSHVGNRERLAPSLFAHTLKTKRWVPVDRGNVPELVVPSEAWIQAAQTPLRIQERIPRIGESMYETRGGAGLAKALGLTDAGRPRVLDLLALLESIAKEAKEAGQTNREIDLAARWVQRTLNDVLREDQEPHQLPGSVELLAIRAGKSQFVAQPPYTDDLLLRETFENQLFLLSAETGLTKLYRYLALARLDDEITTSPYPLGEVSDAAFVKISRQIDNVKPYLLALVRSENSNAGDRVRPALRNLKYVICENLVLNYKYGNTEMSRDDAVCYIASHLEKRGKRNVTVGTAYLEVDSTTGMPHWFQFGRQLAQFLSVSSLSDAFTMLLTSTAEDRSRMMTDRMIRNEDLKEAHEQLLMAQEDTQLLNVLDLVNVGKGTDEELLVDASPVHQLLNEIRASEPETGATPQWQAKTNVATEPPPPINFSALIIEDGVPGDIVDSVSLKRTGSVGGGGGRVPEIQSDAENRRIGQRGEEAAYHAERHRIERLGKNPELVQWVSQKIQTAPYDLISVDKDDQRIYIEIKSTNSTDPTEPFYISKAELIEAMSRRNCFYIYRVTEVDSEIPKIMRWSDPLGLINEGKGSLLLAKAQMALTNGGDDVQVSKDSRE